MSDFSIWGIGVAASAAVTVAAVIVFIWYSYLKNRLPLAVRYRDLENRVLDLENQCRLFEEAVERNRQELKELLQKKQEVELEIGDARAWLEKNRTELEQLPAKRAEIEAIANQLRTGKETLQKLNDELLQAQAQRLGEAEKAADARREVERSRKELTELQSLKVNLAAQVEKLEKQQKALQVQIGILELDSVKASNKLETLQQDIAKAERTLASLFEDLKKSRAERQSAEQARAEAVGQKESLLREIALKEKDLNRLQREHESLTNKVEAFIEPPSLDKRLEDFLRPVLRLEGRQPRRATSQDGEKRCLQDCAAYIEQCGFKFHPRTLWAFHTSLKTSDISPLVVLAGISGTGKSQLPRLYAEAMGIHFLNVAVQPRWDSPQDLFGFYNYMEHRYKATELARVLRQMDKDWPPKSVNLPTKTDEEKHIQEGVLLVLLDEMNLSRVEYYFSELLSKLEMRNATRDDEARRHLLAAIEIETGSLSRQEESCRLFVGHNVLFAGTLNEDETTQSLSDKVIDRANMLRFGKPGQLQNKSTSRSEPRKEYLLYRDWLSWQLNSFAPESEEQFNRICQDLNTTLAKIHRPFGFRVYQAMYRYIANYPRIEARWFKNALADQLEQKIVSKLRGLSRDTDEAAAEILKEIDDVIHEAGDSDLETAFHAAMERPVFQWSGVNREAKLT